MTGRRLTLEELLESLGHDARSLEHSSAFDHGARVKKSWSEPGDRHQCGARATVLRRVPSSGPVAGYVVRWDDDETPCFVLAAKLRAVD